MNTPDGNIFDIPELDQSSFEYIWSTCIQPIVKRAFSEMDDDFRKKCNVMFTYEDLGHYYCDLKTFFKEKRKWLKEVYLPHQEEPMLDIHKLGALVCRSLLAYKPIYFDYKKAIRYVENKFTGSEENHVEWFLKNIYVNYKIAFYASLGLVFLEIKYQSKKNNDIDKFNFFDAKAKLFFYDKSEKHDNFQNSCMLALQKNDTLGRKFDYLTYAILLYQLEQYNHLCYQLQCEKSN